MTPWTVAYWDFPGKNTGVGCHFLLQGSFLTHRLKLHLLHLLHWQTDSFTEPPRKPIINETLQNHITFINQFLQEYQQQTSSQDLVSTYFVPSTEHHLAWSPRTSTIGIATTGLSARTWMHRLTPPASKKLILPWKPAETQILTQ